MTWPFQPWRKVELPEDRRVVGCVERSATHQDDIAATPTRTTHATAGDDAFRPAASTHPTEPGSATRIAGNVGCVERSATHQDDMAAAPTRTTHSTAGDDAFRPAASTHPTEPGSATRIAGNAGCVERSATHQDDIAATPTRTTHATAGDDAFRPAASTHPTEPGSATGIAGTVGCVERSATHQDDIAAAPTRMIHATAGIDALRPPASTHPTEPGSARGDRRQRRMRGTQRNASGRPKKSPPHPKTRRAMS